jgi:hypothetical protein
MTIAEGMALRVGKAEKPASRAAAKKSASVSTAKKAAAPGTKKRAAAKKAAQKKTDG